VKYHHTRKQRHTPVNSAWAEPGVDLVKGLAGHPPRDEDTDGVSVPGGEVPLGLEPSHDSGEGNDRGRHDRRIVQRQGQRVRHVDS
jgi:hypothetical protein